MRFNKRFLGVLIFLILLGTAIYGFQKRVTSLDTKPVQESVVTQTESKSNCSERLKDQTDTAVEMFEGFSKIIDFSTQPLAKEFFTVINRAVSAGPNFAGHYTLASWGCGTDCFSYAVIDAKTGEIIAYNPSNEEYLLGNFRLDSKVLVLEPVHAGQERKFYKVIQDPTGKSQFELACTEVSTKEAYGPGE